MRLKLYVPISNDGFILLIKNITYTMAIFGWVASFIVIFPAHLPIEVKSFLIIFTTLNLLCLNVQYKTISFLLSIFTSITCFRLANLASIESLEVIYLLTTLLQCIYFVSLLHINYKHINHNQRGYYLLYTEHTYFVRLVIGCIFIPHFCEKLFAGSHIRAADIHDFVQLGVSHACLFVFLSGFIEFIGSLALVCGFLTRATSLVLFLYLMVASVLGHHFQIGFIWATPGGGWEYPFLWSMLILSFSILGAGEFSFDYIIQKKYSVPVMIHWMMGLSYKKEGGC